MKHFIGLGICATLLVSCGGEDKKEQSAEEQVTEAPALNMSNPETKLNYAIGMGAGITFEERIAFFGIPQEELMPQEALNGFKDHINGTSSTGPQQCQEDLGALVQKKQSGGTLSTEEIKSVCYSYGVLLADGALNKMKQLEVGDIIQNQAIIAGAEHQFLKQPTAISKQDMQELITNLEVDRSKQNATDANKEPISVIEGIDELDDQQKKSYVLGMNNGLNLLQNIASLSPGMAAQVDVQKIVDQVDSKYGSTEAMDNAQFQSYVQDFLSHEQNPAAMPQDVKDNFSNAIALTLVESKKNQEASFGVTGIDKEQFMDGLSSVLLRKEAKMSIKDHDLFLTDLAKKKGTEFLAANAKKPGVKVTASGLQYKVLKSGSGGPKPKPSDRVKVHYHGTLIDGTVFDSSVDRGEPSEFGVTQVIQGWIEGLQLMSVGDKFEFYIPQELAYGASPRPGGVIKPYDALVFQVELLEIK